MRPNRRLSTALLVCLSLYTAVYSARADGPADNNNPDKVARIPKLGVEVPAADRKELESQLKLLGEAITQIGALKDAKLAALAPDVRIFHKAAHDALQYQEFFAAGDIAKAKNLLKKGRERAEMILKGDTTWTASPDLVVRGYVSKIDGSVQPYGIVLPPSYTPKTAGKYRLDVWLHGRGETLSEVNFLDEHLKSRGEFTPADTIVLHPYGRYCNAFKFAGEVDVLEAMDSVKKYYRVDEERIAIRGFSMGGAGVWHLAVHYPDLWFAANPGAGFSETPDFLKVFQKETVEPTAWERTLWKLYDCPYYASNLRHCPTVAYSGADDTQKQAADVMEKALEREGLRLRHVIGPGTKHAYHPEAKKTVEAALDSLAIKGRDRVPEEIQFTTETLKYNRCNWVTIEGLERHWQTAEVSAEIDANAAPGKIRIETDNVTDLRLDFPAGAYPFELAKTGPTVTVDPTEEKNQNLKTPVPFADKSWTCSLYRDGNKKWHVGERPDAGLRKQHNLQGPIDDAFMDSFIIVRPTGTAHHADVEKWVQAEMAHAIEHWRTHFRGEARVKDDKDITDEDIAGANLILWGDPNSNQLLAKVADKLPVGWSENEITVGKRAYDADHHALAMIYPNPLNPKRYVVLNSGFTFREYDYLNNARQVPKLPDWAVIDLTTPPNSRYPGKVEAADFFDEAWKVK